MSLILAILLGLFLFIRIASEKQSTKAARREYEKLNAEYEERSKRFRELHEDMELEHSVRADQAMCEEARNLIRGNTGIINPSFKMVQMVAMAKYGKIPSEFISEWCTHFSFYAKGDAVERREQSKKYLDFLRFYNQLLRSNGVDEDIVIVACQKTPKGLKFKPVPILEYTGDRVFPATWESVNWTPVPHRTGANIGSLEVLRWE